jgi:hypothetical protein
MSSMASSVVMCPLLDTCMDPTTVICLGKQDHFNPENGLSVAK